MTSGAGLMNVSRLRLLPAGSGRWCVRLLVRQQARAVRPAAPREEVPTMVKHYVKYALSTLSAAMFAHMA
ncbi:hypothetical protein GTY54_34090 [Streptomyces sp. SID625]|nr:hypothetical protein [Streptomyces sp. SID625]